MILKIFASVQVDADGLCKWAVPAKGNYEQFLSVEKGTVLSYTVQVIVAESVMRKHHAISTCYLCVTC